jgi:SAM-dependent methyltransferase
MREGYSDVISYSRLFDLMQPDLEVVTAVLDVLQPTEIVEIGCGSGRLLPMYLRSNANLILGIDVEPEMVRAFGACEDCRVHARLGDVRDVLADIPSTALIVITSSLLKHFPAHDRKRAWKALAQTAAADQPIYVDHSAYIYGVEQTTPWASYADTLGAWWPPEFRSALSQFHWRKDVHGERERLYFRKGGEPPNCIVGYRYDLDTFVSDAAAEQVVYYPIGHRYPASRNGGGERRIGLMVRQPTSNWADTAARISAFAYTHCDS